MIVGKFSISRSPSASAWSSMSSHKNLTHEYSEANALKALRKSRQVPHHSAHRQITRNSSEEGISRSVEDCFTATQKNHQGENDTVRTYAEGKSMKHTPEKRTLDSAWLRCETGIYLFVCMASNPSRAITSSPFEPETPSFWRLAIRP